MLSLQASGYHPAKHKKSNLKQKKGGEREREGENCFTTQLPKIKLS